jgi:hypothetical protein
MSNAEYVMVRLVMKIAFSHPLFLGNQISHLDFLKAGGVPKRQNFIT